MKKHRIKRIIALSLVLALSLALLTGYSYPVAAAETAHPDLNRATTDHTVTIVTDLSKTYNGEIVDTPIFKVDDMDTDTSMTYHYVWYYKWSDVTGTFEPHEEIPREVGRYRVKITVCPSGHGSIENPYAEGNRDFEITGIPKHENGIAHDGYDFWCPNMVLGQAPRPNCIVNHGIPTYQYSQNEEGPYSDAIPDVPGTWYVRAVVEEDDEYYRFESKPISFEVKKAPNSWTKALTIADITFGEEPEPKAEAAHGTVTYQYSNTKTGSYTDVPPVFPGTWYVKAVVAEGDTYEGLESAPVEFTVKAVNEWTEELSMSDITFGEPPAPSASAVHGTVKYQYSQSEAGPYTDELPNAVGVWYVKAVVAADNTYSGLESAPARFEVKKEGNEWERELTISNIALGEKPEPKAEAAHGIVTYYYSQTETGPYTEEFPNTRGTWYVKAVVAAGDTYSGLESAPVSFEVGKMKNEWTIKLTMSDVILGDKPEPKAEAAHGNVRYQYSRNEEGPYSDALPDVPGTWYVRAIVSENETYALLESEPASFVLIDLDEYVPPLVEPDNTDKPGEDKNNPVISGQPGDEEASGKVMTPTDTSGEKIVKKVDDTAGKAADKTVNGVKTGDNSPIVLIMICCVLSAGLGLGMLLKRRRKTSNV